MKDSYKKECQERADKLRAKGAEISEFLGAGWALVDNKDQDGDWPTHYIELTGPVDDTTKQAKIYIHADNSGVRYEISGSYRTKEHVTRPATIRANASATKTAEQIARDITRRILPEYIPLLIKYEDDIALSEAEESLRLDIISEIAKGLGVTVDRGPAYSHASDSKYSWGAGKIDINGENAHLDIAVDYHGAEAEIELRIPIDRLRVLLPALREAVRE